ncbi:hypothetical protein C8R42DRAFT_712316 [Lentinula raphanica]|nr:hypothetical protein C8R42DRAFT_712316 [Lentinula raphanica]
MTKEDQLLDKASRLGSAKKRKPSKAERAKRVAAARAARAANQKGALEDEVESKESSKENDLEHAHTKISVLQKRGEALRKKTLYWKKKSDQLQSELEERERDEVEKAEEERKHQLEREEEEERQRIERENVEKQREQHRRLCLEEKDEQIQDLQKQLEREQKRRRTEADAHSEMVERLEGKLQDYQRHTTNYPGVPLADSSHPETFRGFDTRMRIRALAHWQQLGSGTVNVQCSVFTNHRA